ncbi:helix-turn-helix domain-containing protein [Aerococcus urinaeequi]|uniref:Helix-turn-helix domain-containing protein n=1 Tax=Aerococcus urinaeequi TaxID=51665 RepID=A0AAE9XQY1_9LACT|nr:helix-turn-helix domain-containing protein [Aerococcus urinaeequi]WCG37728.1 helix-turn-helix domain-containing protein [Aerococcus urinaeequi]
MEVYFTEREKSILNLLLAYPKGVTQKDIQDELDISKRTVYREISHIEESLRQLNLRLDKPRNEGYYLIGSDEDKVALRDQLNAHPYGGLSKAQRQNAIALMVLSGQGISTVEAMAYDFSVSVRTLNTDMASIKASLSEYTIQIESSSHSNLKVKGEETVIRQLIVNLLDYNIKEIDFFLYFNQMTEQGQLPHSEDAFFIQLIPSEIYEIAHQIFKSELIHHKLSNLPDNQLKTIILSFVVNIFRIRQGYSIHSEILAKDQSSHFVRLSHQMYEIIAKEMKLAIDFNERHMFARQLEGMNFNRPQNIFSNNFDTELSYRVAELTRKISAKTGYDFRQDNRLFEDLLTHLNAALKRLDQAITSDDIILDKMIAGYPNLHEAVDLSLKEVFPDVTFTKEEMAYIIIHYASSIERQPISRNLKIVILSAGGFGTSKILESRFSNKIPEVKHLDIVKVSQMSKVDYDQYDLILSTSFLAGFNYPYQVISPLLLDDEIMAIRQEIKHLSQSKERTQASQQANGSADMQFERLYQLVNTANKILEKFDIHQVQSKETVEASLLEIIQGLSDQVVEDPDQVTKRVIQRYLEAPIGIPHSNIALFHSTNPQVKEAFFSIYELDRPFEILGMDRTTIKLKRILLLLAPEPLSRENELLLGKISSSIIDNDLNTEIYKSGTKAIVLQLLSALFVEETTTFE